MKNYETAIECMGFPRQVTNKSCSLKKHIEASFFDFTRHMAIMAQEQSRPVDEIFKEIRKSSMKRQAILPQENANSNASAKAKEFYTG